MHHRPRQPCVPLLCVRVASKLLHLKTQAGPLVQYLPRPPPVFRLRQRSQGLLLLAAELLLLPLALALKSLLSS